jgi:predicted type IV restriction endonuclease
MPINITKEFKKYIPSKFFEEVLGYDIFTEISKEHIIKDRMVDYAIKLGGKVEFLVEVKQAGIKLKEKHIEQASNYAANSGVPWVVLTSGGYWQLYHLTFDEGIQSDLIWSIDILEGDLKETAPKIAFLHRKNVLKGELEDYYAKLETLSPKSIIQAIFHEDALKIIRKHLKKMSGIRVDEQDLVTYIKKMISKEAWEEIGDIKVKRKSRASKPKPKKEKPALTVVTPITTETPVAQADPSKPIK